MITDISLGYGQKDLLEWLPANLKRRIINLKETFWEKITSKIFEILFLARLKNFKNA